MYPGKIKTDEHRVGLVPATVRELVAHGHHVEVERRAGEGAGIADEEYVASGAQIVGAPNRIFERAELIVKVKEPLAAEPSASGCIGVKLSSPKSGPRA